MFLIKLWDRDDRELIIDLHRKVIISRPKLTTQINSVSKHILKTVFSAFLGKTKTKKERRKYE